MTQGSAMVDREAVPMAIGLAFVDVVFKRGWVRQNAVTLTEGQPPYGINYTIATPLPCLPTQLKVFGKTYAESNLCAVKTIPL